MGLDRRPRRERARRRPAARRRQDRRQRRRRGRRPSALTDGPGGGAAPPPRDRRADALGQPPRVGRALGAPPPRALRRRGLPGRPERRGRSRSRAASSPWPTPSTTSPAGSPGRPPMTVADAMLDLERALGQRVRPGRRRRPARPGGPRRHRHRPARRLTETRPRCRPSRAVARRAARPRRRRASRRASSPRPPTAWRRPRRRRPACCSCSTRAPRPVRLIAARVSQSPEIAAQVLRLGNSALFTEPVDTHRARGRAHRRAHAARPAAGRQHLPPARGPGRRPTASRASTWCATAARSPRWPSRSRARAPAALVSQAYLAGLLHDLGKPILATVAEERGRARCRRAASPRSPTSASLFGTDHAKRGRLDRPPLGPSRGPLPRDGAPPRPAPARRGRGPAGVARRHRRARRRRRRRRRSSACPRPPRPAAWPPTPSRRC